MSNIKDLHDQALDIADNAFREKRKGNKEKSIEYFFVH